MHFWIDIDNPEHIPLLKSIVTELKERGHTVCVTSTSSNEVTNLLQKENLNAKAIGNIFSFFKPIEDLSVFIRTTLLTNYIKNRNINVVFSLGSKTIVYASSALDIPIIVLIEDTNEKINWVYFTLYKSYFILPDSVSERPLIDRGYDIKAISKYKGFIKKDELNPNPRIIKDIVNQIEKLSSYKDVKA